MMISLCGCRSTQENDNGESGQQKTESKSGEKTIGGVTYEKAEYEKFNSYDENHTLRGTPIYLDGEVGEIKYVLKEQNLYDFDTIYLSIIQTDGKEWLVDFEREPIANLQQLQAMNGKKVRVYCLYSGLSNLYKEPVVELFYEKCWIKDLDNGDRFTWEDFINDIDSMTEWCDENDLELNVDDIADASKKGFIGKTSGIIDSVSVENSEFTIFTKSKTDSLKKYTFNVSTPLIVNKPVDIASLNYGDNVAVYYRIGFDDNLPYVLIVEKVEDVGITQDDIFTFISKDYKAYTYKEIARNPDKVKGNKSMFIGKVIQVMEQGDYVNLRVNITVSDWGIYTDTVYVTYTKKSSDEDRILEDDIVMILGTLDGLYTYEAVSGAQVTLPLIQSDYIKIIE